MGEWLQIADLFDFEKGSLQSSKCTPGDFTFITAAEEWKTHDEFTHDCEALIFAMGASGSLGRTHYFKGKFIASDLCFILLPKKHLKLDLTFYYYIFNFLRAEIVSKLAKGTSKLAINQKNFGDYKLPYFDYDHQLFFREKLKNIGGITSKIGNEFDEQLSYLKQLRQAVLQEAVEGKLTAEWRKQHPVVKGDPRYDAAALLAQIKAEKERLIKEGEIRKEKPLTPIADADKPFDLPEGWVWCLGEEIGEYIDPQPSHRTPPEVQNGIPYVSMKDVNAYGEINFSSARKVSKAVLDEHLERYQIATGDFFIGKIGTIGNPVWLSPPQNYTLSANTVLIQPRQSYIHPRYMFSVLKSDYCLSHMSEVSSEMSYPVFGIKKMRLMPFPLPSPAEQQAIVVRIDSLMAVIDELEKQVVDRKEQAQLLMQTVLREAFAGGG